MVTLICSNTKLLGLQFEMDYQSLTKSVDVLACEPFQTLAKA